VLFHEWLQWLVAEMAVPAEVAQLVQPEQLELCLPLPQVVFERRTNQPCVPSLIRLSLPWRQKHLVVLEEVGQKLGRCQVLAVAT